MQAPSPVLARIMIVDDDLLSLKMLQGHLLRAGYRVIAELSAQVAIAKITELQPDMILLDVNMEEMDGFEACQRIKAEPLNSDIPVIFVTGDTEAESILKGFRVGAVDYVTKPIRQPELLARIHTHLSLYQLKNQLKQQNQQLQLEIKERQALMEQIIQAKQEWEAVFNSVTDMILLTDTKGQLLRCNQAVLTRFGSGESNDLDWQQIRGQSIDQLFYGPQASPGQLKGTKEGQFPRLPGWFEVSLYPVYNDGDLLMNVYIVKETTLRKRMEAVLLTSQKYASLGTLVAGIAHEINSPLQVITGLSEKIASGTGAGSDDLQRLRNQAAMIHRNAWRVAEIVRALRTYAHGSGQQFEPHNLNAIVADTLLLTEHQMESWSNILISTDLDPDLPAIECDRDKISQALINLLTNARDALPAGGEVVITTCYNAGQDRVVLTVQDNGVGIPEEIREKIFDPFFTTKAIGQGSGLGLSIVMGIMRSHRGEITVESRVKQGSTFILQFPIKMETGKDAHQGERALAEGRFDRD